MKFLNTMRPFVLGFLALASPSFADAEILCVPVRQWTISLGLDPGANVILTGHTIKTLYLGTFASVYSQASDEKTGVPYSVYLRKVSVDDILKGKTSASNRELNVIELLECSGCEIDTNNNFIYENKVPAHNEIYELFQLYNLDGSPIMSSMWASDQFIDVLNRVQKEFSADFFSPDCGVRSIRDKSEDEIVKSILRATDSNAPEK